jgi:serine/threonine-protein kinase
MKECPVCKRCFPDEINHCPQDGDVTSPTLLGDPTLDGRYVLERRLGQGGMGVVFQARHIFLKTSHAIKVILPDLVGNDPMLATRFRQEALAAAAIRHQNIIAVTDFGVVRGTMPFLVMEFIKGKSLQDILGQEGPMSPERAWELIGPVAAGVGAAHRQKIVHRDLKPLNIMLQDEVPVAEGIKILDFGLAKIKSGELLGSFVQAQTSGLMGSPFYMAPEQLSDDEPDARADIYSLGVILYQMLSGEVPFKGSSIPSIMKKHLTQPPPSFQSMGVSVPPAVEAVVRHALEKEADARIDSVATFLKELQAALNSSPGTASKRRQTGGLDPNQTIASAFSSTTSQPDPLSATGSQSPHTNDTQFAASFESLAGTVSASELDTNVKQQLTDTAAAHRREKEDQERLAREEQKRLEAKQAEEERIKLEEAAKKEREAREREQQEKLERMAVQARELEDRLKRLSVSMPPATAIDPETTHVQRVGSTTQAMTNSIPAGTGQIMPESGTKKAVPFLFVAAALIVLVLAGVGIGGYLMFRPKPSVEVVTNQPPKTTDKPPTAKAELLPIDGGKFIMGRDKGPRQETPGHPIEVHGFLMDRTEVTNAEYADFVRETNHAYPSHWGGSKPPFGQEKWPVVNVSFDDVNAFATWRSKRDSVSYRLPTEEEWEYAARNGSNDDLYPWGKTWELNKAVVKEAAPFDVGSRPEGKNKWGVVDLLGNVWEWTASRVSAYPGNPITIPDSTKDWVTIRGGCYVSDPANVDKPVSSCLREFVPPSTKNTLLGFRLVRSGS